MVGPLFIILQAARYGIGMHMHMLRKVLPHLSKGQLSEETMVQGENVQGDFGPRRRLSMEAFTSDMISLLKFFSFILYWILQY